MNKNPSAFPLSPIGTDGYPRKAPTEGMSLRDYFAGQALALLVGSPEHNVKPAEGDTPQQTYAKVAYSLADAMLEARKAEK